MNESCGGIIKAQLKNTGCVPLLHIYPYCSEEFNLLCDRSYITLFPGEAAEIKIQYSPKFESGFLNHDLKCESTRPEIRFDYFNM